MNGRPDCSWGGTAILGVNEIDETPAQTNPVSLPRHYNYEWLRTLPGLFSELSELIEQPTGWISTPAVWTAAFRCVLKGSDILPGVEERGVPYSALSVSLKIISSAKTLLGAIELLQEIARLANFPVRLEVNITSDEAYIICTYKDDDAGFRADIEVLHVTFLMSVMQWLTGDHIPFRQFSCRSKDFLNNHSIHPDYQCPLILEDVTGCRFPSAWLDKPVSESLSDISMEETLIWLVHDHPEDFIIPQGSALDEEGMKATDRADNLPLFKSVGGRQKRRKLVAQCGLTLRDLKQRYVARRAKFMLVEGSKTVAQIASDLGYADEGSFRRFFKRMTGFAPIEFMKTDEFINLTEVCRLIGTLRELR